ncbi:MAG: hypothetical protein UZ07_CHB004000526, partial [Chlorobi bacterium OLB7]
LVSWLVPSGVKEPANQANAQQDKPNHQPHQHDDGPKK